MTDEPKPHATPRELLVFYAKLIGLLLGLTAFGFLIFLFTRSIQFPK
jgi:hypothetical protein